MFQEGLLGGQEQPRATKSVPRASQERPKSVPRAAKSVPRAVKSVPRAAKSAPRERSWRPELPKTRQEAPKRLQVGLQRRPREFQELQNSSPSAIRQQTAPPCKNHEKHCKVLQKSRFAGPALDAKMGLRSDLRREKNTSSDNRRKSQIVARFGFHFGTILGTKIDVKSYQKMSRKSIPQKIDKKTPQKSNYYH